MESRWNKVGSYPCMSYFNGNGNELKLQFFEHTGEMFIMFSNPSEELAKDCGHYCGKEMAANGRDIKSIYITPNYMTAAPTSIVLRAVLKHYSFDDNTKKEIQDTVNLFHNMKHYLNRYSFFAGRPLSSLKEEEIKAAVLAMPRSRAWV